MKCNQTGGKCDNENMLACKKCYAPTLCQCRRPEVRVMVNQLWRKAKTAADSGAGENFSQRAKGVI